MNRAAQRAGVARNLAAMEEWCREAWEEARAPLMARPRKWPHGYGRCHCGCGRDTPIADVNEWRSMPGDPLDFMPGHALQHHANRKRARRTWLGMKARCASEAHPYYGGRRERDGGPVEVCARWRDDFEAFYRDMGPRPHGLSIDRIDPWGHYSCGRCDDCLDNRWPPNCRWADDWTQANNTRRNHPRTERTDV